MGKQRRVRAKPAADAFFDRFRSEVQRYAVGVHLLGRPTSPAELAAAAQRLGPALAPELRSFLASWNGAELFHESTVIAGVGASAVGGQLPRQPEPDQALQWAEGHLAFASAPGGLSLAIDAECRVWGWDDDEEEVVLEATSFERWLTAVMAREALVMDGDGEYREDSFDEDELSAAVEIAREQKTLTIDPGAVGPSLRLALAERRSGDLARARELLEALLAGPLPVPASARIELARTAATLGDHARALAVARELVTATRPPAPRVAMLAAEAARWARDTRHPHVQEELAARARELSHDVLTHLREGGAYELAAERPEAARELLETARALAPRDLAVLELLRRLG